MFKKLFHLIYFLSAGISHSFRALTPAGLAVLFAMLVTGAIGVDTSEAMSFQTFALLLAAFFVAGLWYCIPIPTLQLSRELPRYGRAGRKLCYPVRISNPDRGARSDLTLSEDFGDYRPTRDEYLRWEEPGEEKRNVVDRAFGFYRWNWLLDRKRPAVSEEIPFPIGENLAETEVQMEILPLKRGVLRLAPAFVSARDPLGLARRTRRIGAHQSVLILPRLYAIPDGAAFGHQDLPAGGEKPTQTLGGTHEFLSIRDHRHGESLRHVHWKCSARSDKLMVRELMDEFIVKQAIVLDTFDNGRSPDLFEEAVSLAASFAVAHRAGGVPLDFFFVQESVVHWRGGDGEASAEQILERLAEVQVCRNHRFEVLTEMLLQYLPRVEGAVCIFLEWDELRRELVRKIRKAGVALRVIVIVPEGDKNLPAPGPLANDPGHFVCLRVGQIEAGLAALV